MTVVMAGCGDLGTATGLRFAAAGHRVLGLRRSPEQLPDAIEGQGVDLTRRRPQLPPDTDIVVIAITADGRSEQAYRAAYVHGLTNVLDAVHRSLPVPPRVLFVSSTAVYGVTDGSWVDEDTPAEPPSATATVLATAERCLHERIPTATALRLSGIYGPGRGTMLTRVRSGGATLAPTSPYTNRIHRDDAAAAIVHLTTALDEPQSVYIGADDEPTDRASLLRFLTDELGVPRPAVDPDAPDRGLGKRCRNTRLRDTGFLLTYPTYREGYRSIIRAG